MRPSQLCQLAGEWRGDIPDGGMLWQEKRDGWRGLYLRDWQHKPGLFTRNGHPIEGVGHILHRLAEIEEAFGCKMMLDGEFQVGGTLAATKHWCETGWRAGGEAGQLFLFDAVPLDDWQRGECPIPLVQRLNALREAVDASAGDGWTWRPGSRGRDESLPPVVMLEDGWAFTAQEVVQEVQQVWAREGEGIVLKDAEAGYIRARSNAWAKVKRDNAHKWMRKAA